MKKLTGHIDINNLHVYAHHGVMAQERVVGNDFSVSASLYFNCDAPMQYDHIAGSINYADVIDIICREMDKPANLLERVAARLHKTLTAQFPQITSGSITVAKIAPPIPVQLDSVSFTIEW